MTTRRDRNPNYRRCWSSAEIETVVLEVLAAVTDDALEQSRGTGTPPLNALRGGVVRVHCSWHGHIPPDAFREAVGELMEVAQMAADCHSDLSCLCKHRVPLALAKVRAHLEKR